MLTRSRASALVIAASVAILASTAALHGCATFAKPEGQLTAQIATQYATGKFIEAEKTPELRVARARAVAKVAENVKAVATSQAATVAQLRDLAMSQIARANLMPSDRLLANTLVDVAVQELAARVSTGALSPDAQVVVTRLLDWVIAAAAAYA